MFLKSRFLASLLSSFTRFQFPCSSNSSLTLQARLSRQLNITNVAMPKRKSRGAQSNVAAKQVCTDSSVSLVQVEMEAVDQVKPGCEGEAQMRVTAEAAAQPNGTTGVQEIKEGKATILFPESVFYNPVQEFNRDLTVSVISEYALEFAGDVTVPPAGQHSENGIRILEALGASGLRSVRFAKEIPGIKEIVCNDFDDKAVEYIKTNIEKNGVGNLVRANRGDASLFMHQCRTYESKFDVIDLDPYGSPTHFLDGALQAIKDGGLLCVTATDMAVMSGNFGETCFTKYGSYAIRTKSCHEMGLRILLRAIESHATRYSKYTVPILSVSVDFYIRVFVRVYEGAAMAKFSACKQGMIYQCNSCGTQSVQPLGYSIPQENGLFKHIPGTGPPVGRRCDHCGDRHKVAGPIWIGRIHDKMFVSRLQSLLEPRKDIGTYRRLIGTLKMIHEELDDVVLYYVLEEFSRTLHCLTVPVVKFRSALLNAGYQVSGSHAHKNALKTNAPMSVLWDILRLWVQQNPISQKRLATNSVARTILEVPTSIQVSFEKHEDANPESKEQGFLRFQMNPQKDWGPKSRPKREDDGSDVAQKKKNRNKKKNKKLVPCNFTASGKECPKGEECQYSHDPEVAKNFVPYLKRLPCKKYLKGVCEVDEAVCKFHHKGQVILDVKGNPRATVVKTEGANEEEGDPALSEAIGNSMDVEAPPATDRARGEPSALAGGVMHIPVCPVPIQSLPPYKKPEKIPE